MKNQPEKHHGLPVSAFRGVFKGSHQRREVALYAKKLLLGFIAVLAIILAGRMLIEGYKYFVLASKSEDASKLHVRTIRAKDVSAETRLTLPGTIESYSQAAIFARTNGYVKEWYKDIGQLVKQGELLATLETPEIDKEVEETQATYDLAKAAYERWIKLRREDAVPQQELDEKRSAFFYAKAALERAKELVKFGKIVAPFDGIISKRNISVGDLVNSGNVGTAQALFTISKKDQLHVYVYVPQSRSNDIPLGQTATLFEPQSPGKLYNANIAKTAGAIDPTSRTLQIDVAIPDGENLLLPGSYVEVKLPVSNTGRLIFPTKTILYGANGTEVAIVRDGKVIRQKVDLGIDYGDTVEILSGVTADDNIVINPPDNISTGQSVIVEDPEKSKAKAAS